MRPLTPAFRIAALVALAGAVTLGLGRCAGQRDGQQREQDRIAIQHGQRLARQFRADRDSMAVLDNMATIARQQAAQAETRTRRTEMLLAQALDSAEAMLADTGASREALRAELARVTADSRAHLATAQAFRDAAAARAAADSAVIAQAMTALAVADSTIAAQDAVITRLNRRIDCRMLGLLPCPSRLETALGAVGLTLLAVLAL